MRETCTEKSEFSNFGICAFVLSAVVGVQIVKLMYIETRILPASRLGQTLVGIVSLAFPQFCV